jgi:hypothetical protein
VEDCLFSVEEGHDIGESETLHHSLAPFDIRVIIPELGADSTNMPNALILPTKAIT